MDENKNAPKHERKTLWQFIKFLLVSGIAGILQIILVNLLCWALAAAGLPDRDIQRVRRRRRERQLGLCVPVLRLEPAREYLRVHSEQKDDLQVRCTRVVLCGVSGADGLPDPVLNMAARRNRERAALDRRGAVERACADDSRGRRGDIPDGRALPSGEVCAAQGKEGIENKRACCISYSTPNTFIRNSFKIPAARDPSRRGSAQALF